MNKTVLIFCISSRKSVRFCSESRFSKIYSAKLYHQPKYRLQHLWPYQIRVGLWKNYPYFSTLPSTNVPDRNVSTDILRSRYGDTQCVRSSASALQECAGWSHCISLFLPLQRKKHLRSCILCHAGTDLTVLFFPAVSQSQFHIILFSGSRIRMDVVLLYSVSGRC